MTKNPAVTTGHSKAPTPEPKTSCKILNQNIQLLHVRLETTTELTKYLVRRPDIGKPSFSTLLHPLPHPLPVFRPRPTASSSTPNSYRCSKANFSRVFLFFSHPESTSSHKRLFHPFPTNHINLLFPAASSTYPSPILGIVIK